MQKRKKSKHYHITSFQIIILGFLSVILIGSLLLMLPIATRSGNGVSFPMPYLLQHQRFV